MHELETAFGLADGFDRERPNIHRLLRLQLDADAKPFIAKSQMIDIRQLEPRAQVANGLAARIEEIPVTAVCRQPREIELHAEMHQLAGRQPFYQIRDL